MVGTRRGICLSFYIILLVVFARTTCVSRTNSFVAMVRSSTLVLALVVSAVAAPAPAARACAWPSWKGVRHMFVLCVYGFCLCVEAGWAVSLWWRR
jgi:hypothetical protein